MKTNPKKTALSICFRYGYPIKLCHWMVRNLEVAKKRNRVLTVHGFGAKKDF
jgi:hypothetical protein